MEIWLGIEPVTQLRPRFSTRPYPHEYDPPKVKAYKTMLHSVLLDKMKELGFKEPLDGSLEVNLRFYRSIQKSGSKELKARKNNGRVLPNVKPDSDNYVKAFFDACNGAVWKDDALITDFSVKKRYSDHPRIELEVLSLNEQ